MVATLAVLHNLEAMREAEGALQAAQAQVIATIDRCLQTQAAITRALMERVREAQMAGLQPTEADMRVINESLALHDVLGRIQNVQYARDRCQAEAIRTRDAFLAAFNHRDRRLVRLVERSRSANGGNMRRRVQANAPAVVRAARERRVPSSIATAPIE
jgi:hypothetical protein